MEAEQFPEPGAQVREIPAQALLERLEAGEAVTVLDTRRPADSEAGADGAADAARQLHDILQAIAELPEETLVAPGHTSPGGEPAAAGTYTARRPQA